MEINFEKAKEYYSSLSDSELLDQLKSQKSESRTEIKKLIEDILKSRDVPVNVLNTTNKERYVVTSRVTKIFNWWMVVGAFAVVVVLHSNQMGLKVEYLTGRTFLLALAGSLGYVLLPIFIVFAIMYARKKPGQSIDIKEAIFYGCGATILLTILMIFSS